MVLFTLPYMIKSIHGIMITFVVDSKWIDRCYKLTSGKEKNVAEKQDFILTKDLI